MSLYFQSFNYSSNVKNCVNKQTSQRQGKNYSHDTTKISFLNKSSSDITSKRFPLTIQSNGIGIIGGISVDSSLNFAKKLVNYENGENSPTSFVLYSDPTINNDILSFEVNYFASKNGKHSTSRFDHSSIVEKMRRKRMFLEKSEICSCVVMPCDLLHCWYDEIERGCSVRFLHVGECVAKELRAAKLRPIETGSLIRIGVLAANENLVAKFYQEKLENQGFEVVLPDKATIEHIVIPAVEALNRKDFEGAQNLFRIALQLLLVRAVNKIIIASNDLRQLLPPNDPLWTKCIDPMDALARSSIDYVKSIERKRS